MKFEAVKQHVQDVPIMTPYKGKIIYDFIIENEPQEVLELGFFHGTSSCYIAAALDEIRGHLTTVDLHGSQELDPNLEQLLQTTGLQNVVTVVRETTTYNWFLKKKLEERTTDHTCAPVYDFVFLDGSKDWTSTAATFFLLDKLLKEGGWVLFDDYNWKYKRKDGTIATHAIGYNPNMGPDELEQSHISLAFHLLVMQHPDYGEFKIQDDNWAWAHKVRHASKTLKVTTNYTLSALLVRFLRRFA
jgi:predicted O-methyltransferase YrrM